MMIRAEPREVGARSGAARVEPVFGAGNVEAPGPGHRRPGEHIAARAFPIGRRVQVAIGDRIDEQLPGKRGPPRSRASNATTVARLPPHCRRHHQPLGLPRNSEAAGRPFRRGVGVIQAVGKGVLGGEPVIDRHDHDARRAVSPGKPRRASRDCPSPSRRRENTPKPETDQAPRE